MNLFTYSTLNELIEQIEHITKCKVCDVETHNRYWLIAIFRPDKFPGATIRIKALIPY